MTEEQYERLQMAFSAGLAEADDIEDAQTLAAALDMDLKILLDRFRKEELATELVYACHRHVLYRGVVCLHKLVAKTHRRYDGLTT